MAFVQGYEFDAMSQTPLYHRVTDRLLDLCALAPGATVADVGCGSGLATEGLLARYGDSVETIVGVDPSEFELSIARARVKHPRVKFLLGRAQDLRGFVGAVDATVLSNVLHQIPAAEREPVLAGCFEVLKPGGRCALNTLFYEGAIVPETRDFYLRWMAETDKWLRARGKRIEKPKSTPIALQMLTPKQHEEILRAVGFTDATALEVRYDWSVDDWTALSRYSVFVEGSTGLSDVPLGSDALVAGVRATFAGLGVSTMPRNWLFASGLRR